MTNFLVKDLIEALRELDQNLPVYLSSDDEWNGIRKACFPSQCKARTYPPNDDYYAEPICDEDFEKLDEEDKLKFKEIVVL